jgi:hypothetical protein
MTEYFFKIIPHHVQLPATIVKVRALDIEDARSEAASAYAGHAAKEFFGPSGIATDIDDDTELDIVLALSGAAENGGNEDMIEFSMKWITAVDPKYVGIDATSCLVETA